MIKVKCAVTIMQTKFLLCPTWKDKNDLSAALHYKTIETLLTLVEHLLRATIKMA